MITERSSAASDGDGQRVRYDRNGDESPSVAVATALADFYDEDATASSIQLYDYVDPEALDALFAHTHGGVGRTTGEVRFEVENATVVVRPDTVHVY